MDTLINDLLGNRRMELIDHFKPNFLGRVKTIFNFEFDIDPPLFLIVEGDSFLFNEGTQSNPTITIYLSNHQTLWDLLTGSVDGMDIFMEGKYRADGNLILSQLLLYLFKPDRSEEKQPDSFS